MGLSFISNNFLQQVSRFKKNARVMRSSNDNSGVVCYLKENGSVERRRKRWKKN